MVTGRRRASPPLTRLGDLERAVMQQVWAAADEGQRSVSVREVHERLPGGRDLAYTTVMTVMTRLSEKGLLTKDRRGRAHRYAAAGTREALTASAMLDQLHALGSDTRRAAMLHFLDEATSEEIEDLKAALSEVEARAQRSRAED